jgi:hypothetical protein
VTGVAVPDGTRPPFFDVAEAPDAQTGEAVNLLTDSALSDLCGVPLSTVTFADDATHRRTIVVH